MKLSENANYLEYMRAFADEKYEAARLALGKCLNDSQEPAYNRAFLLQCLGNIYFLEQDEQKSIEYFQLAEMTDPKSLLPRYMFAKFLAEKLGRCEDAIKKCDNILLNATASPFNEAEEDFGSDYYITKTNELKSFCEEKLKSRPVE